MDWNPTEKTDPAFIWHTRGFLTTSKRGPDETPDPGAKKGANLKASPLFLLSLTRPPTDPLLSSHQSPLAPAQVGYRSNSGAYVMKKRKTNLLCQATAAKGPTHPFRLLGGWFASWRVNHAFRTCTDCTRSTRLVHPGRSDTP